MRARALLVATCFVATLTLPVSAQAGEAQSAITKAQAKTLAKAAILKKTDLVGFKAERQATDPSDAEGDAALYECVGAKVPAYLAENPGFAYTKGELEIDSESSVVSTGKAAKADLKSFNTQKAADCWAQQFRTAFEGEGITIDKASVKLVKVTVAGAKAAFAYKYDISGSYEAIPVRLRGFAVNALSGQTELTVSSIRYDGSLPKLGQAVKLAGVAVARVKAV